MVEWATSSQVDTGAVSDRDRGLRHGVGLAVRTHDQSVVEDQATTTGQVSKRIAELSSELATQYDLRIGRNHVAGTVAQLEQAGHLLELGTEINVETLDIEQGR